MDDRALRPRSGTSAKAMLLTILGELVLPHGGAVWTSTLVRGFGLLDVEERNARQAIARLADEGTLRSEKQGRRARWHLTPEGRQLLVDGTRRIYGLGTGDDEWDGRWLVVFASVPEEQRAKRHQLRTRLEFEGFGFVAPGVAVSPHLDREAAATAVLTALGLVPGALVFRAEAGSVVDSDDLLLRAWDLDVLASEYESFVARFAGTAPSGDDAAFADLVELVHEWRRFPFLDPGLPARLLPRAWPGHAALALFARRRAAATPGAVRWYSEAESAAS